MFLNIKNYKERAMSFETNYQQLDILLNKIERLECTPELITKYELKGLHREYEKLLLERENHHDIDYMTSSDELKEKFKFEITRYKIKNSIINFLVAIYPIILIIIINLVNIALSIHFK
jgi:hypothetical protein